MNYANKCCFPYKIIIADGGLENEFVDVLTPENYPNLDFEYLRYPYDQTYTHYFSKLVDAISKSQTP
ncbi:MAG: hypothetical protein JKY09_00205, partial [Crocinitomicaceae bacterium]|nr:hypothetical protein [Crocinitomicaceae bacterium]